MLSTSYTFLTAGPALETQFLPVVNVLSVDRIEPLGPVASRVWASYRKMRPCEYIGTAWYHVDSLDGAIEQVGMTLTPRDPGDTTPPTRPLGFIRAGPWKITMPADQIRDQSLVEVFHNCHFLWVTRSHFYP